MLLPNPVSSVVSHSGGVSTLNLCLTLLQYCRLYWSKRTAAPDSASLRDYPATLGRKLLPGHKAGRQSRSRFFGSPRQIQNLADRFEIQKFVRIFPDISRLEIEIEI